MSRHSVERRSLSKPDSDSETSTGEIERMPAVLHYRSSVHRSSIDEDFHKASTPPIDQQSTWLVSRRFDLLFVCGLAPWLLAVVAFLVTAGALDKPLPSQLDRGLTFLLAFASLIIGESHQFTSILRYFGRRFRGRKYPYTLQRVPIWLICFSSTFAIALTIFGMSTQDNVIFAFIGAGIVMVGPFMMALFPVVLMQHFCAQSKAIGILYCRLSGFELTKGEFRALSVVAWLLVLAGAVTIASPFVVPATSPVMTLGRDVFVPLAATGSFLLGHHFWVRGQKTGEWLPRQTVLTWANMVLFTVIPLSGMVYVWLFVPLFFHATQHWAVAWHTHEKERSRYHGQPLSSE
ncbi:MAG: hypothetical protein K2Z81_23300, partial [Cyanobacteria bacterium]|nr:hypothetical protein [Cyanobacteriota bacterium]